MSNNFRNIGEKGVKDVFKSLVCTTTPNGFEHLVYEFIPTSHRDAYGNRFVINGEGPHHHLFTCHLDTYPEYDIDDNITSRKVNIIDEGNIIRTDGTSILGADDKAGMTIMLFMIHAGLPGIYGFFLAEERGLYGSEFAAQDKHCMEIMRDVKAVISFDRKGTSSIITHQRKTRTCSDRYAMELQSAFKNAGIMLNPDPEGFATDSFSFHKKNPSLECTNISVGFWDQHTCCEYQDIAYLEQLSKATISMKWPIH